MSNSNEEMHPTGYPPTTTNHHHHSTTTTMQQLAMHVVPHGSHHHHHHTATAALLALPVGVAMPQGAMPLAAKAKRMCRFPGCTKVIKSQGHCQRHGARAKRCRVDGCDKQAQGTHDGMCKRHWKAHNFPEEPPPEPEVLEPVGESAYDSLLPRSIAYRPVPTTADGDINSTRTLMPLVQALKEGAETKEIGWHRNAERAARGLPPVENISNHMEPWEKQLALIEILLLSGGTPHANFRHLAHAWGRERGFHHVLINTICERRGEVDRKRRSDAREYTLAASKKRRNSYGHDDVETKPGESIYLHAAGVLDGDDDEEDEPSPPHQSKRAAQV